MKSCVGLCKVVIRLGGHVYWEWPRRCRAWKLRLIARFCKWLQRKGCQTHWVKLDGCMYGLKNPRSGKLLQKPWTVLSTDPKLCRISRTCSRHHRRSFKHEVIQGSAVTASTAFYPAAMVQAVVSVWQDE